MDTVVQAVRVSLLIMMTFAFAAVWSADYSKSNVVKHRPQEGQKNLPTSDLNEQPSTPMENHLGASLASPNLVSEFNLGIPLPEGIPTGTYLIVNQFGRTTTRFIVQPKSSSDGNQAYVPATDHYTSILGNARWHFIRIESNVADRMAIVPASTSGIQ